LEQAEREGYREDFEKTFDFREREEKEDRALRALLEMSLVGIAR